MNLMELFFQRRKAKAQAAKLLDSAFAESRSLTVAEQVQFDGLAVHIEELDQAIQARQSLRKLVN
jgi:hypothetical protein